MIWMVLTGLQALKMRTSFFETQLTTVYSPLASEGKAKVPSSWDKALQM